jgi:hypothetical protein
MNPTCEDFVKKLNALCPTDDDLELETTLSELIDLIDDVEDAQDVIPNIFNFIERFPHADHGSPGPLVHFIERFYPKYVEILIESIERKPTLHTLWMLNRILNSSLNQETRKKLMDLLESTSKHTLADVLVKEEAEGFLKHQKQRNG